MNEQYVGLTLAEAKYKAQQAGLTVATPMLLTNAYNPSRITFTVENGIVTSAEIG